MEILAPVKNYESCKVAIQSGCDAIYCAANQFGARVNASIEIDELKKIIYYCNLYDVKVYITCNTVIFEDELEELFTLLDQLYLWGIDGILIQDIGLVKIIKNHYADLEVHASTQMNIDNLDAISICEEEGISRVVLPREMPIERIKELRAKTNLELEVFGHGALCVSYSGLCFDSTLLDQKSANRGRCSQYCRMEQEIINRRNGQVIRSGHPLNLKDLNTTTTFKKYQEAGVDSFKIEGRLKGLDYVMVNTANYQALNHNQDPYLDPRNVYNRTFTKGRVNGINGSELVNLERENNSGIQIGKVIDINNNVDNKTKYYKYIVNIQTNEEINPLDNLRFVNDKNEVGQIVDRVEKISNGYLLYTNLELSINDIVYKTLNQKLIDSAQNLAKTFTRRVNVDVYVDIDNRYYVINDEVKTFDLTTLDGGSITSKKQIIEKLTKTKNTMFDLNLDINYSDDLNILQKSLKALKNDILQTIINQRLKSRVSNPIKYTKQNFDRKNKTSNTFYIEVRSLEQYQAIGKNLDVIVIINNLELAQQITPTKRDYLLIPRVMYDDQYAKYDEVVDEFAGVVVSELGAIKHYQGYNMISNFTLNTTNHYQLDWLKNHGVNNQYLSIELNKEKYQMLATPDTIVGIYGRVPIMIMDYCPINHNKTNTCGSCMRCHSGNYYLHDKLNREFPLLYEGDYRIGMYANIPINLFSKINELEDMGINQFYITLTIEDEMQTKSIIDTIVGNKELNIKSSSGSYYKEVL